MGLLQQQMHILWGLMGPHGQTNPSHLLSQGCSPGIVAVLYLLIDCWNMLEHP